MYVALAPIGGRTSMDADLFSLPDAFSRARGWHAVSGYTFIRDRELQSLQVAGISRQWHAAEWRTREGARRSTSPTEAALPGPSLQVSFQSFIYYLCFELIVLHSNVFSTPQYSLSTSHRASVIGYGEIALRRLVPRAR